VVQFGDNDSGRFLAIGSGEQVRAQNDPAAIEWSLDHRSLVAGIRALTGRGKSHSVPDDPGTWLLRSFAGDAEVLVKAPSLASVHTVGGLGAADEQTWLDHLQRHENSKPHQRWAVHFSAERNGLLQDLEFHAFPGMGCFVFRSPRFYLAIRCGEIGLAGLGAHAHCDQLAIELVVDGMDLTRDPGSFIYTASAEGRNSYRSAMAHHVPRVTGREPANLDLGPFDLRGAAEGDCLYVGPLGFVGRHQGYGPWVYRVVVLHDDRISVLDFAEGDLSLADPTPTLIPFSPGYGRQIDERARPS
jgi:hypothetical protein